MSQISFYTKSKGECISVINLNIQYNRLSFSFKADCPHHKQPIKRSALHYFTIGNRRQYKL